MYSHFSQQFQLLFLYKRVPLHFYQVKCLQFSEIYDIFKNWFSQHLLIRFYIVMCCQNKEPIINNNLDWGDIPNNIVSMEHFSRFFFDAQKRKQLKFAGQKFITENIEIMTLIYADQHQVRTSAHSLGFDWWKEPIIWGKKPICTANSGCWSHRKGEKESEKNNRIWLINESFSHGVCRSQYNDQMRTPID